MPRHKRLESPLGYYHVVQRGTGKQLLFENEKDYLRYQNKILECKDIIRFQLVAFCLMDNHVHLLIKASHIEDVSRLMRMLGTSYARYFNTKYDRSGYVFQDRYHSIPIENEKQLFDCVRYIHNNPVKAGYCNKREEYFWSSYRNYINGFGVADIEPILELMGGLRQFLAISSSKDDYQMSAIESTDMMMERGLRIINKQLGYEYDNGFIVNQLSRPLRNAVIKELKNNGFSPKKIELLTGVSKTIQRRI